MTRITRFLILILICASAAAWRPAIAGAEGSPLQQVNYTYYTLQSDAPPTPPELPGAEIPMEAFLESGGPAAGGSCCATPPACGCAAPRVPASCGCAAACAPAACCAPAPCCNSACGHHCGHASGCPGRRLLSMIFDHDRSLRANRYRLSCGCKSACCGAPAPACGCGHAAGWHPAASAAPSQVEERRRMPSGSTIDFAGDRADYGDIDWTIAPSPPSR
jgi:hypothetical protein